MAIGVLVADDHEVVRDGLRCVFHDTEIEIMAEAADQESVVRLAQRQLCDVVLLDIGWPDRDSMLPCGFDTLRQIKTARPDLPVVVYSMHDRERYKQLSRELGASGYVVKGVPITTVVEAIRKAYAGEDLWRRDSRKKSFARRI